MSICSHLQGQRVFPDPPPEPVVEAPALKEETELSGTSASENELIMRQLRETAGRGPLAAAEAIGSLTRLKRFDQAAQLIRTLKLEGINVELQASMARKIGIDRIPLLLASGEIDQAGRQKLTQLVSALSGSVNNAERIDAAIGTYLKANPGDAELAAARAILRAGDTAIAIITNRLLSTDKTSDRQRLVGLLKRLGSDAFVPIERFLLFGNEEQRSAAIATMTFVSAPTRSQVASLLAIGHSPYATQEQRSAAANCLRRTGNWESEIVAVTSSLIRDVARLDRIRYEVAASKQVTSDWAVESQPVSIQRVRMSESAKIARDRYDASTRVAWIRPNQAAATVRLQSADLA
ncbi:MAG: hypothetical protein AAF664_13785, partial [Planctomycetota bacterium]